MIKLKVREGYVRFEFSNEKEASEWKGYVKHACSTCDSLINTDIEITSINNAVYAFCEGYDIVRLLIALSRRGML